MITLPRVPPNTPEWVQWRQDAVTATAALIAEAIARGDAGMGKRVKSKLYGACKNDLFIASSGKCGFCESRIKDLNQHGDVEHFRPKGAVRDEQNKVVKRPNGSNHPGYYWLGYEWDNFVPSCILCNQLSTTPSGTLIGKGNRFPVAGPRAFSPADNVAAEDPLLLNPFFDDPALHLELKDPKKGILGWRTARGEATIKILGLNREGLCTARAQVYDSTVAIASLHYLAVVKHLATPGSPRPIDATIEGIQNGAAEFSFAARQALDLVKSAGGQF